MPVVDKATKEVHKQIMLTRQASINNDDFNPEEAVEAAVDKRKFLILRLLKDYKKYIHAITPRFFTQP